MHQRQRTAQEEGVTQAYKLPPGGQGVRGYNSAHKIHYHERAMWSERGREQGSRRGGRGGSCVAKSAVR
jgi:hypothetical protein